MEAILDTQENQKANTKQISAEEIKSQLSSGTTLADRYMIQDVIGVGGMGSVYRARDLHFPGVNKVVAVKEMVNRAPDPLLRKNIIQNFEREANILATLNHPSIPRIYDYFSRNDRSYLVLEFIHGRNLESLIEDASISITEELALGWAIELCDVLAYLHGHHPEPIVFRDMKPSNVMIDHENHVMLVDFGIAKTFQYGQKGTMIGTEGYSPPEQYRGEAGIQADLYALGATLHHALTRRDPRLEPPFSFHERPVRRFNPSISPEMEAVINASLQYNASDRFNNAEDMKEALLAAGRKTGVLKHPIGRTATVQAVAQVKPLWTFECEDEIRGTPLCHRDIIYIGSYDHNLYSINSSDGRMNWKHATEGGVVTRPVVAGENVFFGSQDGCLYAVHAGNGKLDWSYVTDGPVHASPRISEGHVIIGSDDHRVHAVNIATSRAAWRFETGSPVRSTPFLGADSVFIGNENGDFYCVNFHGKLKWHFKAKTAITSSPLEMEGVVYFASTDSNLYALDARAGWVIWRFRMGKGSISSPAVGEEMVFIGSADGNIYGIDAHTSKERWHFKSGHQVASSPTLHKDALYCGSADGNLYCLEARTGRLRWRFTTKGPITGSPIIHRDNLIFGSTDHNVYCLAV